MNFFIGPFLWSFRNFFKEPLYRTIAESCFWELVLYLYIHPKTKKLTKLGKSFRKISEICSNLTLEQRESCGFDVFIIKFPHFALVFLFLLPSEAFF